jgi:hypothetical protein
VPWQVYTLAGPETHAVRYVGATKLSTSLRLSLHITNATCRKSPLAGWLSGLAEESARPLVQTVEIVTAPWTQGLQDTREADWIGIFLKRGAALLNVQNVARAKAMHEIEDDRVTPGARALFGVMNRRALAIAEVAAEFRVASPTVCNWLRPGYAPAPPMRPKLEQWSEGAIPAAIWEAAAHRAGA